MAGTLLKQLDFDPTPDQGTIKMKEKCQRNMKKAEREEELKYLEEMKTLKEDLNLDDLYFKKFGLLKKASILSYYGRKKDAKYWIASAAEIVQGQRRKDEEK